MKTILLLACITATALCVPYLEVEHTYRSPHGQVGTGPSHHTSVEYLIPLGGQQDTVPVASNVDPAAPQTESLYPPQAFIKQEIPQPPGIASVEVLYPFSGFRRPALAVPAAPVYPAAPVQSAKTDDEEKDD